MTCHEARDLFSARIDDALTVDERASLDAHLTACPECRRELARFEQTVGLLRAATPVHAPAGFVDRVLAAVRPVPQPTGWYRRLGRRLFWPLAVKLPLEAAALVLVAVGAVYLYERSPELQQAARQEPLATRATEPLRDAPGAAPGAPVAKRAPAEPAYRRAETPSEDAPLASSAPSAEAPAEQRAAPAPPPSPPGRKEAPAPSAPTPPAAAPERSAEVGGSAREGERRPDAAEEKPKSGAVQDRQRFATAKSSAPVDVAGRLAVGDRAAAERALAELLQRVGATEVARRGEGGAVVVEVLVAGSAYRELVEGLARIGRWQLDRQLAEPSPAAVRVILRITD